MPPVDWNPEQYLLFKEERARPFHDLLAMIEKKPIDKAIDLGCGTGELTRVLHDTLQCQETLGTDNSPAMLEKAHAHQTIGLSFHQNNIEQFDTDARYDLVFSNAALQWVGGHRTLFPKLLGVIRDGGQIAIQMPYNFEHFSHRSAASIAEEYFPYIKSQRPSFVEMLTQEEYAEMLFENGCKTQICRMQIYGHVLQQPQDMVEWTKGTLLTFYQRQLSHDDFQRFLELYTAEITKRITKTPYFYPFKRLLFWGKK